MLQKKPLRRRALTSAEAEPRRRKKVFSGFKIQVRSRHPSHKPLRTRLPKLPFRTVVRFGSESQVTTPPGKTRYEVNSAEAVRNSANKLRMKRCFSAGNVKTATWAPADAHTTFRTEGTRTKTKEFIRFGVADPGVIELQFPVVTKSHMGSRGRGNTLIKTQAEYEAWARGKNLGNYIVEKFHNYNREYRLHVTRNGCFYTCRKMLRESTPEEQRWFRNDSNSVWIMENNPQFDRPVNWDAIVQDCVKALSSVGLDVGACDVKVQSALDGDGRAIPAPDYIIIEINSAPSFGDVTLEKYLEKIPEILRDKKLNSTR